MRKSVPLLTAMPDVAYDPHCELNCEQNPREYVNWIDTRSRACVGEILNTQVDEGEYQGS